MKTLHRLFSPRNIPVFQYSIIPVLLLPLACSRGDASATVRRGTAYRSVRIADVPHVKQRPDFCGEACVEMFCRKLNRRVTQDDVFNLSGLDPLRGRGCYTAELVRAAKALGFDTGRVWYPVKASRADADLERLWKNVHAELVKGVPAILCMRYDETPGAGEHFRLVLGYDAGKDEVLYHEPAEDGGAYRRMKRTALQKLWPLKYHAEYWKAVWIRLDPVRAMTFRRRAGRTDADYAQHIRTLKKEKIKQKPFQILIQRPFVVIGDESSEMVRHRARRTVKWAVDKLKQDFFAKDPDEIIDIWLFRDKKSYRKHTLALFGDRPSTPFGYYSSSEKALIMNISTGGGTLVHEIVHPFVRANFPECPDWLNEGLGSLYEQCTERNGHIVGRTNWRLAGLQTAIRAGRVPSFQTLTGTTGHRFYSDDPGTNYAQARYLCYYLQEKGKLVSFYHAFRRSRKTDPTGYKTLRETLGEKDMDAFKKKWEAYVLKLSFH